MKVWHVAIFAVVTFCWIWLLPLMCAFALLSVPLALVALPLSMCISVLLQWHCHDRIIARSWLRRALSAIPWHQWFPCNTLEAVSRYESHIAVHPHGVLCCGAVVGIHMLPRSRTDFCVAPVLFYVPFFG